MSSDSSEAEDQPTVDPDAPVDTRTSLQKLMGYPIEKPEPRLKTETDEVGHGIIEREKEEQYMMLQDDLEPQAGQKHHSISQTNTRQQSPMTSSEIKIEESHRSLQGQNGAQTYDHRQQSQEVELTQERSAERFEPAQPAPQQPKVNSNQILQAIRGEASYDPNTEGRKSTLAERGKGQGRSSTIPLHELQGHNSMDWKNSTTIAAQSNRSPQERHANLRI